ncbi:MAG TPA: hypothetical protein VN920_08695, partial [Pyrinomonadaceae bacterium]|nr:hypothetical protein [Pyrinomonadaceae bacterium]
CAVALVTVAPPTVFAQTLARPATSVIEPNLPAPPANSKSDLKKSLAAEVAKVKGRPLTEADLKRLEKEQQDQESGSPPKARWTRRNTVFMTLWIVVMTGVVVVLIKHHCRAPKPCAEIDSSDY